MARFFQAFHKKVEYDAKKKLPSVLIIDATYMIKYLHQNFKNGDHYFRSQFETPIQRYFNNGANLVYLCFDRHSPICKSAEQKKRMVGTIPWQTPTSTYQVECIRVEDVNQMDKMGKFIKTTESNLFLSGEFKNEKHSTKVFNLLEAEKIARGTIDATNEEVSDDDRGFGDVLDASDHPQVDEKKGAKDKLMPTPFNLLVTTDLTIPIPAHWKSVMANKELKAEIIHYLTCKLSMDPSMSGVIYTSGVLKSNYLRNNVPGPSQILALHGGISDKPYRSIDASTINPPDDFLLIIENRNIPNKVTPVRHVTRNNTDHPRNIISNLGEGEIACAYYSAAHQNDQRVKTVDGDMIWILLGTCEDRFHQNTTKFKNQVELELKVPGGGKGPAKSKSSASPKSANMDLVLDINKLYKLLSKDEVFSKYLDPVATLTLLSFLPGNDYIDGYVPGLTSGSDKTTGIPWVICPALNFPEKYKNMITMKKEVSPDTIRYCNNLSGANRYNKKHPQLDYELFIEYTHDCYYFKYKDQANIKKKIAKKITELKNSPKNEFDMLLDITLKKTDRMATIDSETLRKISICCIKEHLLETSKNASRHMMSDEQIIGIGRRSCWLLDYWANGYRGSCTYEDPCATYGGKSYYGWKMSEDNENECVPTNDVSEEIRDLSLKYNLNRYEDNTGDDVNLLSNSGEDSFEAHKIEGKNEFSIYADDSTYASDNEFFNIDAEEDEKMNDFKNIEMHGDIFDLGEGVTSTEMQRNQDLLKRLYSDETNDVENKEEIPTSDDRKHKHRHRHRRRRSHNQSHTTGHRHRHGSDHGSSSTIEHEASSIKTERRLGKEPEDWDLGDITGHEYGHSSDEDDLESIFTKLIKRGAENAPELDESEGRIKKKQKTLIL